MRIDECFEVEIIDDNHNGCGICKINDIPVFVKGCLIGDVVNIKITKIFKKYALGEVISFVVKSNNHVEVLCPYYNICGGCNLMHVSYEREIELKKNYLMRIFKDKFVDVISFDRFNYRNKVKLHVKNGKIGFYDEMSNNLVCISKCLLLDSDINSFIEFLSEFDLSLVKEIVIRKGDNGLLLFVTGNLDFDVLSMIRGYDKVVSIYLNDVCLYGDSYLISSLGDVKYFINHKAFFQVNSKCSRALYDSIKSSVSFSDKLLDLYCGMASIGIYISDICNSITGVEVSDESVKCARINIRNNLVSNYKVLLGDASCICEDFDTIVVDPPRSGLSKSVVSNINNMKASKLIYVSCNPSTLKRDIELLSSYTLDSVYGFNMFPCTKHVECVSVLYLKNFEGSVC